MKKGIFIETENVTRAWRAIQQAEDTEKGRPGMVALWGDAGRGKTFAAHRAYTENGGFFFRAFEGMTLHVFMQELAQEICKVRPTGTARCRSLILGALEKLISAGEQCTLYIDEADRLPLTLLEATRDFHDGTGCPVVFIGEQHLPGRLAERPRIADRIPFEYRVEFKKITVQDVLFYADEGANLTLAPDAAARIVTETDGNFRRIHNLMLSVESAVRASSGPASGTGSDGGQVSAKLVDEVLKKLKGGR